MIKHYYLPVKFFVLNNDEYLSIRTTQRKFFKERLVRTDQKNDISFSDFKKLMVTGSNFNHKSDEFIMR